MDDPWPPEKGTLPWAALLGPWDDRETAFPYLSFMISQAAVFPKWVSTEKVRCYCNWSRKTDHNPWVDLRGLNCRRLISVVALLGQVHNPGRYQHHVIPNHHLWIRKLPQRSNDPPKCLVIVVGYIHLIAIHHCFRLFRHWLTVSMCHFF